MKKSEIQHAPQEQHSLVFRKQYEGGHPPIRHEWQIHVMSLTLVINKYQYRVEYAAC